MAMIRAICNKGSKGWWFFLMAVLTRVCCCYSQLCDGLCMHHRLHKSKGPMPFYLSHYISLYIKALPCNPCLIFRTQKQPSFFFLCCCCLYVSVLPFFSCLLPLILLLLAEWLAMLLTCLFLRQICLPTLAPSMSQTDAMSNHLQPLILQKWLSLGTRTSYIPWSGLPACMSL